MRVNDRGPYHADRLIDVSVRTAKLLDFYDRGVTRVRVDYVGHAAIEGSDDTKLAATLRSGTPAPGPAEVRLASSRPFLPQSTEPSRRAVPLPADRPFELGHDEAISRVATRQDTRHDARHDARQPASEVAAVSRQPIAPVTVSSRNAPAAAPKSAPSLAKSREPKAAEPDQWERGFAARFAPAGSLPSAPTGTVPVSAFAGPAPSNGAIVSGRGLY